MHEVIPGILEKEWSAIEKKLEIVRPFSRIVHIDIIDGKFASNTTFLDPEPFAKYSKDFFFELHMMVEDPISYLDSFAKAGFRRFLGHIEKMPNQAEFVAKAQNVGEVGLAIDGPTSLKEISVSFEDLDSLLIFTAEKVGFSGQSFLPERLEKAKKIHTEQPDLRIEVDGGMTIETITQSAQSGASRFVATSAIFKSANPIKAYQALLSRVSSDLAAV